MTLSVSEQSAPAAVMGGSQWEVRGMGSRKQDEEKEEVGMEMEE